jgi:hypothetical protein
LKITNSGAFTDRRIFLCWYNQELEGNEWNIRGWKCAGDGRAWYGIALDDEKKRVKCNYCGIK